MGASGLLCPRCKQLGSGGESCSHCGFSFRETCDFDRIEAQAAPAELPEFDREALVGRVIGDRYRVLEVLGEGGFGVVYKVEFLLFDEHSTFALKVLHPHLSGDEVVRRRFLREARLAMSFTHENAVQVRELGQTDDGLLYFTMDYCGGESLKSVLDREKIISVGRALAIARQILAVVQVAHARGVLHRDLKPENIFLERDVRGRERVKVGDFGLAKSVGGLHGGAAGRVVGSPRYMSPEQHDGAPLDERSDLYSVGVILFEMVHGTVPADSDFDDAGLLRVRGKQSRCAPRELVDVLRRALARRRELRVGTAEHFLRLVDGLAAAAPEPARPPLMARVAVAAVALVALLILFFLLVSVWAPPARGPTPVVSWPPPTDTRGGALDSAGEAASQPESDGSSQAVALDSSMLERMAPERIQEFVPLKPGRMFEYAFHIPSAGEPTHRRFEIVEREGRGRYLVRVEPDGYEFRWVLNPVENTFAREFRLPNPETGAVTVERTEVLLRLPLRPGDRAAWGAPGRVTVRPVNGVLEVYGQTFEGCVEVTEIDEDSRQRVVRFFQRGVGEVATHTFDLYTGELLFGRVLIHREE